MDTTQSPRNHEEKRALRRELRQRRSSLSTTELAEYSRRLAATGQQLFAELFASMASADSTARPTMALSQHIAAYYPMATEPPMTELLTAFAAAGHSIYLPTPDAAKNLLWAPWEPAQRLQPSEYTPTLVSAAKAVSFAELPRISAIFLPALAMDTEGHRLGQGGGYYDRFLAQIRPSTEAPARIAVVYPWEVLPAIPLEPWDAGVDIILTPEYYSWAKR